jgi:L-rhamnose-H+ transport protein
MVYYVRAINSVWSGYSSFALILIASAMNAAFAIPLRFLSRWSWATAWALWTVAALILVPLATALITIPSLLRVYELSQGPTLLLMMLFGALWGCGMLMIGKSYSEAGVAITNAVALGTASVVGATIPLFAGYKHRLTSTSVLPIEVAIAVLVGGVILCGLAGGARESQTRSHHAGLLTRGVLLAAVGGALTASLNAAVTYGDNIVAAVRLLDPANTMATNAVWVPVLIAGSIPGIVYTFVLISRSHSLPEFTCPNTKIYWPIVTGMAVLWFASLWIYGLEIPKMGRLGPIIGWPVFMSGILVFSFFWSAFTGEWKGARIKPIALMLSGLLLQAAAMGYLAKATQPM